MRTVHFWEVICITFIYIVLCFAQDTSRPQADVIKHCENSTNWPSCSYAYEQLYKHLTKPENSFNISHALYPGRGKPSLLVKVNVYGPNKTTFPTPAMFTWSIHCLYATVPGQMLEILSLGSILVRSRTQELNIQIPPFCCNMSDDKKEREEIIQGFLTRAITELQDLAVSPTIRDPSLNTAECIRQGHNPTMDTTGRTAHIRAMLWCSLVFTIFSGPLLSIYINEYVRFGQNIEQKKKNAAKAMYLAFKVFSVIGNVVLIAAFYFSLHEVEATHAIVPIIPLIFGYSVALSIYVVVKISMLGILARDEEMSRRIKCCFWMKFMLLIFFSTYNTNAISYLFCWLIIGIRINPAWGLTISLLVICVYATVTYTIYLYHENETTGIMGILVWVAGCLSVLLLFAVVFLAGQSYNGEETAVVEVLKTASLYFIGAFISWATWSLHKSVPNTQNTGISPLPYKERRQYSEASAERTPLTTRETSV